MSCHVCGQEAISRCFSCGRLFCEKHGQETCVRCQTGITASDLRADRVSAQRLSPSGERAWWRPQEADEYVPPACHLCQGLARRTCVYCQKLYCADHAGRDGGCSECNRSAWMANLVIAIIVLAVAGLLLLRLLWPIE